MKYPLLNNLTLIRFLRSSHGVIGRLQYDGKLLAYTLEHNTKLVPSGTYAMDFSYSPKFGTNLPLVLVPSRTGIRIHVGNTQKDTSGCILVGEYSSPSKIVNSRVIFRAMLPFLEHINTLKIIESYDGK